MKKLIEQTENYNVYQSDFMGYTQTFRQWNNNQVEIQFNDSFAKANGHRSVEDMLNSNKGMRETLMANCGCIPQWINIGVDGSFSVRITQTDQSIN